MIRRFLARLSMLLGRRRFHEELHEEMAFHREQAEREFMADGMKPDEARRAAAVRFGNATKLDEDSTAVVSFRMETVMQDVRFALRQLRKAPGFAVTAILILTLGMGISVAMFGFVDAALVRPLPFYQPTRLLSVDESAAMIPRSNLSRDDYDDWKRMNTTLSSLEVYGSTGFLLHMGSISAPVPAGRVSAGYFRTLGIKPILGRDFLPGEDQPGKPKIVLLSYGTWLKRFSGRRDVVGQSVNLSGDNYTIVGVLPPEIAYAPRGSREFWAPLLDKNGCEQRRSCHNLDGIGRLRDGVTIGQATDEMKRIAAQLAIQYPGSNQGQGANVQLLSDLLIGDVRPILRMLLSGACLLLLIACVNVASLLLVRSENRRREVAVRGALGATPARLARQFVTEGVMLTAGGCGAGLLLATWLMSLLKRLVPQNMADSLPFLSRVGLNGHVFVFAALVAVLSTLLLTMIPVMRLARQNVHEALAEGGRGAAGRFWNRLGANLVVVELTIAVVLLAGAGLLGKSFYKLLHVETGIDPTHLATVNVMLPDRMVTKNEQAVAMYHEIRRRLLALPGVQSVGLTTDLPIQCNCDTDWIRIVGKPFHGEHNEVDERDVSPEYLATLKARLVRGRMITEDDIGAKPHVMVINEALARKYFPGEDPIGRKVGNGGLTPDSMREIVGVVADVREGGLDQDLWPSEYMAIYQTTDNYFAVAVRTAQDEGSMLPSIVSTLRSMNPDIGVYGESTMAVQIDTSQTALLHRFATWLVAGFAAMALVLGVVGLYGVISYSVSQRTREIGVRMALGAQRSTVYQMVMRQAVRLTLVGVGVGLACSVAACQLMRRMLFGVAAWDAPTLLGVAAILASAAMLASFLPARRAALVNPSEALRAE